MPRNWSVRPFIVIGTLTACLVAVPPIARAQTRLTLEDAIARAKRDTPAARALAAERSAASAGLRIARSGYFPRVEAATGLQRGDQPVFVFGSLLSQRRFTEAGFAIEALNRPAALTNVRTTIGFTQTVFDPARTTVAVRGAELSRDMTEAAAGAARQDLALAAARAYVRVLQADAADRATAAAAASADSDLERTRARRDAGMTTTADVLAMDVHAADMRQRRIAAAGELAVARIDLADVTGLPLDGTIVLVTPSLPGSLPDATTLVTQALASHPDHRRAVLQVELAGNARRRARAAFLPTVGVEGAWELDGSRWTNQQSNWVIGAQARMNLFNGFADAARATEARQLEARARAERERIDRRIEVDVRAALTRLAAAQARIDAGRAALAQAREAQRIVRDRYDNGLATATDVLRAAEAVLDAESRATEAEMNAIVEAVALDRAAGRL